MNDFDYSLWYEGIWKWMIPLKLICFGWLVIHDYSLAWNIVLRKGFNCPGICMICNWGEEDVDHVLLNCPFIVAVWDGVLYKLGMIHYPASHSLKTYLTFWINSRKQH